MYFEILSNDKVIKRGASVLSEISWDSELNTVPSMSLTLPAEYLDYIQGREEFKLFANDKCFWGIIKDVDVSKDDETISVSIEHVISEWEYRQISVNNAVKDSELNIVFKGDDVVKSGSEAITASDITVTERQYKNWSNAKLISRSNAKAWSTLNGDNIDITTVTKKDGDSDSEKEITFATARGTKITIDCTISDDADDENSTADASIIDNISDIFYDENFAYPNWQINFLGDAGDYMIDYVYSRQNKLDALTKTIELTEDLWWRVPFVNEKVIEIGRFGDKKNYIVSMKPSGASNIKIIEEPSVNNDFKDVINVATVYSDKSDGGMSTLTLREVFNDEDYQIDGFPVIILRPNVNNERDYSRYKAQPARIAPNNQYEYAVLDIDSIAAEEGKLIEGTYAFNDLGSFATDSKKISDSDRKKAARTAYKAAIRKLKQSRRSYTASVTCEEVPPQLRVGDKVRLVYDNNIWHLEACSNYWQKILKYDDWFYIQKITYDIDDTLVETNKLTLSKMLKLDRETSNEL